MTKFERFIEKCGGLSAFSRTLGVSRQRVMAWKNRRAMPNGIMTHKIILLANGELTFQDIADATKKRKGVKREP